MVRFSIIMAVYNNEKYFPLAVDSVEKQDYDDYELIIIDDGSTDRTSQIADKMAQRNPHIKVVHQKNQWIYNSFNNGIALAQGEYIYILNSDDRLMPGALQLMSDKIDQYAPDVIWTKVLEHVCDIEQNVLVYDCWARDKYVTEERFYKNKREVEEAWPYFVSSKLALNQANLYRRDAIEGRQFRNDVYTADRLFNMSIADRINTAFILKQPVYSFYIYGSKEMNASIGKYYSNEHEASNELYSQYKLLFQEWGLSCDSYKEILYELRMKDLTSELRHLQAFNCPLLLEEKLRFAFCGCIDETLKECITDSNRKEELEARILSAARELLIKEEITVDNKMYFVYELLEALLCYEKEDDDYEKMERAICHPLNPLHIGTSFLQKLSRNKLSS